MPSALSRWVDRGELTACLLYTSIVLLRSPEALARQFFPDGAYKIYLDSEMTEEKVMAVGNPLTEELQQKILSIDGVTDIIPVSYTHLALYRVRIFSCYGQLQWCFAQVHGTCRPEGLRLSCLA